MQISACSASLAPASPQPYCYDTLSYSLGGTDPRAGYNLLTLSGQAYVDTATYIDEVQTWDVPCGNNPRR